MRLKNETKKRQEVCRGWLRSSWRTMKAARTLSSCAMSRIKWIAQARCRPIIVILCRAIISRLAAPICRRQNPQRTKQRALSPLGEYNAQRRALKLPSCATSLLAELWISHAKRVGRSPKVESWILSSATLISARMATFRPDANWELTNWNLCGILARLIRRPRRREREREKE